MVKVKFGLSIVYDYNEKEPGIVKPPNELFFTH